MKINNINTGGFSLLEIMITVAIIGIMAVTVTVSFGGFEQTVRVRETAGAVTDILKNLELDMVRRDYLRQTVHFEPDYLVIEAEAENQSPTLLLEYQAPDCVKAVNSGSKTAYLAQRDPDGNNMDIFSVPVGPQKTVCGDFLNAKENEWQYQLFLNADRSQTIRFIHFNLRRSDNPATRVSIADNPYTLEVTAPYASKEIYENGVLATGKVEITLLSDDQEDEEIVVLQDDLTP